MIGSRPSSREIKQLEKVVEANTARMKEAVKLVKEMKKILHQLKNRK